MNNKYGGDKNRFVNCFRQINFKALKILKLDGIENEQEFKFES